MLAVWMLAGPAHAARLALVIGNRDYTVGVLKNPVNDAVAMGEALRGLGFQVTPVINLKRDNIGRTVEGFASRIRPGDDVVVFYAGHGVQVNGVNYLPAVDAKINVESDVALNSINLNTLLERLNTAHANVRLLLIDACRDNPYGVSFRSGTRGLARVAAAPTGTLMHFATRPGSVAADGSGRNGLYTSHLLKHLSAPGVTVESMLKRVASGVKHESGGEQQPWTEGALDGEFYFVPASAGNAPAAPTAGPVKDSDGRWPLAVPPPTTQAGSGGPQPEVAVPTTRPGQKPFKRDGRTWLARMMSDYDGTLFTGQRYFVEGEGLRPITGSERQAEALEKFLAVWAHDDPTSEDDDVLRDHALLRLKLIRSTLPLPSPFDDFARSSAQMTAQEVIDLDREARRNRSIIESLGK